MSPSIAVDTSVIVAVSLQEPGFNLYEDLLETTPHLLMSAATRLELGIVCSARGMADKAEMMLRTYDIQVVAFDEEMALQAIDAFERYGKGRHPAALNFGDCCSYALAKVRQIPLLFKGTDFSLTDIRNAMA
jgi:ribonuclease VapC